MLLANQSINYVLELTNHDEFVGFLKQSYFSETLARYKWNALFTRDEMNKKIAYHIFKQFFTVEVDPKVLRSYLTPSQILYQVECSVDHDKSVRNLYYTLYKNSLLERLPEILIFVEGLDIQLNMEKYGWSLAAVKNYIIDFINNDIEADYFLGIVSHKIIK